MSSEQPQEGSEKRFPPPLAESLPEEDAPVPRARPVPPMVQRIDRRPIDSESVSYPELDNALRQANLLRVRGDLTGAERELRRALEIDPANGRAHETLGDILVLSGQNEEALESFKRAQSCGAGAAIEGKIGRIVLRGKSGMLGGANPGLNRGQGAVGIIASALIPGLGLALAGDMTTAAISFGGWLITGGLMLALSGSSGIFQGLGGRGVPQPSTGVEFLILFLGIANLGFWAYSLRQTVRVAKPVEKDGVHD